MSHDKAAEGVLPHRLGWTKELWREPSRRLSAATEEQLRNVAMQVALLALERVEVPEALVADAVRHPGEADHKALLELCERYDVAALAAGDDPGLFAQARAIGALAYALDPDAREAARYAVYEAGFVIEDDEALARLITALV